MLKQAFITLLHYSPSVTDRGPIYHEFHEDWFIKEPWNAISSLFFLIPVFYWIWKLKGRYKAYPMITCILPLLFLNGLGSTMYHAFRNSDFWLMLDFLPALIMMLTLGVYFWSRVTGSWKKGWLIVPIVIGLQITVRIGFQDAGGYIANIMYTLSGLSLIGIPVFIILSKTNWYKAYLILLTATFLVGAVVFRSLDWPSENPLPHILPQGTHFLWHIVSAFAVFSLGWYLYYLRDTKVLENDPFIKE